MKIIEANSFITMPWKNGLGTTQEIFKEQSKDEKFLFRISKASVQVDSDFSIYSGLRRIISILSGNGVILNEYELGTLDTCYEFSGDNQIHSRLINGPVEDFNIFWDPLFYHVKCEVLQSSNSQKVVKLNNLSTNKIYLYLKNGQINDHTAHGLYIIENENDFTFKGCVYQITRSSNVKSM